MEPNNSINQIGNHIDDDGDQNSFPGHRYQIITYSIKRKHSQSQVITLIDSTQVNPLSESSVLGLVLLTHTFSYDIQNLTESFLLEILARLPLKSIFRFKCVCKHHLDLISQPSFSCFCCSHMLTASASSSSLPQNSRSFALSKKVSRILNPRFWELAEKEGDELCTPSVRRNA
ncbi:unnamed protein product [Lactuca saligna]|uniref:F-box domain-containing protein n=1 Tax=Lactuca saligna TaxID=75948 RepID=A0AA35Z4N9_LACSI|nr:unnamed protein product [Lactuca saligna]